MRKNSSLTSPHDFHEVFQRGLVASNRYLVLRYLKKENSEDGNRAGFSVSANLGSAVDRNRTKRLLREAYRKNEGSLKKGYDLVFIARKPLKGRTYREAEEALLSIFAKAALSKGKR
ncbi:MAG TPA: ribonuclease P protein component [Actinobacteria bacterium]|nr:ribonuclease P protein component [Actinomycetota bacterium]